MICVSIAEADSFNLANEIDQALLAGSDIIHLDVANGQKLAIKFGLSFGKVLREHVRNSFLSVEIKIATDHSDILVLAEAGVDYISFRPEVMDDAESIIKTIKTYGSKAGISLDIESEIETHSMLFDQLDFITLSLDEETTTDSCISRADLDRISHVRDMLIEHQSGLSICVAGRITPENVSALVWLGVKRFIIGQTLFESSDYYTTIARLKMTIKSCEDRRDV